MNLEPISRQESVILELMVIFGTIVACSVLSPLIYLTVAAPF